MQTCHRRGAHAIGGMSAFIPNRRDPEVTERAFAQVASDKQREANAGYDGTWVAHPDLVPIAREQFDAVLAGRVNQVERQRDDVRVTAADLLNFKIEDARITNAGIRANIRIAVRYLDSWLRGQGAAAIDNLMEDAATAEISRSQLWQWINQGLVSDEGRPIVRERVEYFIDKYADELAEEPGNRAADAAQLMKELVLGEEFPAFLTVPAYDRYLK